MRFATLGDMDLARNDRDRIDDTGLSQDAPFMRALVAMRLELLWGQVSSHLEARQELDVQPDVRFLEAGIRVLRGLSSLYRLDSPARSPEELVGGVNLSTRELVSAQLEALEALMREQS